MSELEVSFLKRLGLEAECDIMMGSIEYYDPEKTPLQTERESISWALKILGIADDTELYGYSRDERGRPFLRHMSERTISISHTRGYVVIASSTEIAVGVDIECKGERVERVKHKFLREEELMLLEGRSDALDCLHLLWSAKEAAYKLSPTPSASLKGFLCRELQPLGDIGICRLYALEHFGRAIEIYYKHSEDWMLTVAIWSPCEC